ncbi:Os10g0536900, partial [Oryza sativa Japonica Group]
MTPLKKPSSKALGVTASMGTSAPPPAAPPLCGHCCASCATYAGSMVGSCPPPAPPAVVPARYRRLLNELQCDAPMVCAPDSATISRWLSPFAANICVSWLTLAVGGGRLPPVSDDRDTLPSRRPAGTWYAFPPGDAVAGGEGEDVGTGDDAEASLLDAGLDAVDHLEPTQAGVRPGVLLRLVPLRRVDQHRRIAPLHEAVVEVEADEAGGEARVGRHRLAHLLLHDDLRRRARVVVEPHPQLRLQPRRHRQQAHRRHLQVPRQHRRTTASHR